MFLKEAVSFRRLFGAGSVVEKSGAGGKERKGGVKRAGGREGGISPAQPKQSEEAEAHTTLTGKYAVVK